MREVIERRKKEKGKIADSIYLGRKSLLNMY
jgi:hypothetical protein